MDDRIRRISAAVAHDIYHRLFCLGSHQAAPIADDPLEEIRFRVEGAMLAAAAFERIDNSST